MSAEDAGRLRAVSPDIGMEILMARQQAELAAQQQRVEASRAAAAQLISEYSELRPATRHPEVEQLVGLDQAPRGPIRRSRRRPSSTRCSPPRPAAGGAP